MLFGYEMDMYFLLINYKKINKYNNSNNVHHVFFKYYYSSNNVHHVYFAFSYLLYECVVLTYNRMVMYFVQTVSLFCYK